jgi:glycosyltransferase involved in cell wall biosynthesis
MHDIQVFTAVYNGSFNLTKNAVKYKRLGFYFKPFGLSPHISFLSQIGPKIAFTPHDLVIEEFMPPVGFCMTPLWTTKPVISIIQWYFFEYWEKKYRLPFKKIMKIIARTGLYKYFIVQSDAMGREVKKYIPAAVINKIPCGINQKDFIKSPAYGNFVLFLGRIDIHQKGLDMLVRIWKIISYSVKIPLVIAGDGPGKKQLENDFTKAGISNLVTFTGRVAGAEKERLLATCRFMVMPSREETFGMTALEAMAAGKPAVIFNIDNLNEVVRPEWGELADKFDTESFAELVVNLWNNLEYCKAKGSNAIDAAKNFLWDNLADRQHHFYCHIVQKNQW